MNPKISYFIFYGLSNYFRGLSSFIYSIIQPLFIFLENDLKVLEYNLAPDQYLCESKIHAFIYSFLVVFVFSLIFYIYSGDYYLYESLVLLLITYPLLFIFFIVYPKILVKKRIELIERDLVYALKDLNVQVNSGVSLFKAMKNIANGNYGFVSIEFNKVVLDVDAGVPMDSALSRMMARGGSSYINKTIWQIIAVIKSGSNIEAALSSMVHSLKRDQQEKIANHIQEVNLWVLLYLIFAVTIPSIIATVTTVALSIGGVAMNTTPFIFVIIVSCLIQVVIIQYIKIKRPLVSW